MVCCSLPEDDYKFSVLINYGEFAWCDDAKIWHDKLSHTWVTKREELPAARKK